MVMRTQLSYRDSRIAFGDISILVDPRRVERVDVVAIREIEEIRDGSYQNQFQLLIDGTGGCTLQTLPAEESILSDPWYEWKVLPRLNDALKREQKYLAGVFWNAKQVNSRTDVTTLGYFLGIGVLYKEKYFWDIAVESIGREEKIKALKDTSTKV